jgi:hypothetical protein
MFVARRSIGTPLESESQRFLSRTNGRQVRVLELQVPLLCFVRQRSLGANAARLRGAD